ncbi:uncharacterized protein Z519_11509 [Cladophialophora bantiana CBS 173.52]|uniref:Amidohydrolase 3 domain-containing protein n=1 Tax=Cladophialophora bantiana (strain ATCC 10958 / CBS 173.52 / CDC B-1940 / NIH 8579) TaxID=1442370 RepID=A0A0D2HTY2_CLAB1|nr:uncharacterized protein Z519_11509 [Cladophialophora bantiana CBS 173.52]KIW87924.1 hypothetical protein Z519_11509 [Cladophialophora bantiana CBS 173.52]
MSPTIVRNARIFTSADDADDLVAGCLVFQDDGLIQYVGPEEGLESHRQAIMPASGSGVTEIDVDNRIVTPGFIDGHVHMLHFGLSLGKLDASTAGQALASMLDELDPRPIYVEALDLHSIWCSTAALDELGVASMEDPPGGTIHRDGNGRPSGLLDEGSLPLIVWPYLTKTLTVEQKQTALHHAVSAYTQAGYTGAIDMAMDEDDESDQEIQTTLDKAIEMHHTFHPCTAALSQPYGTKPDPIEPIWPAEKMAKIIHQADAAGLQCAVHAIGDKAITQTIDAFASLSMPFSRRHRIEHLELASESDVKRLGKLGIVASVQPVHSYPALFKAWPSLLGAHRCQRAFPYAEFLESGAPLAFRTDAPTAAHLPLPNLYNATTRRSAIEPESSERTNPQFAVSLAAAAKAATAGTAYSRHAERWTGSLKKGASADFVVLDTDWTSAGLLKARVKQTWFQGRQVFDGKD